MVFSVGPEATRSGKIILKCSTSSKRHTEVVTGGDSGAADPPLLNRPQKILPSLYLLRLCGVVAEFEGALGVEILFSLLVFRTNRGKRTGVSRYTFIFNPGKTLWGACLPQMTEGWLILCRRRELNLSGVMKSGNYRPGFQGLKL